MRFYFGGGISGGMLNVSYFHEAHVAFVLLDPSDWWRPPATDMANSWE